MKGSDWLRAQLATFDCPACGRRYRGSRISLLAEREGLVFVDLDCVTCGSNTVAIITIEQGDDQGAIADASDLGRLRPSVRRTVAEEPPVLTVDDVLDMHQFLADFEGTVGELFRAARSDGAKRR